MAQPTPSALRFQGQQLGGVRQREESKGEGTRFVAEFLVTMMMEVCGREKFPGLDITVDRTIIVGSIFAITYLLRLCSFLQSGFITPQLFLDVIMIFAELG